jgi:branched-chain amino acid transport system ATP-binding protein
MSGRAPSPPLLALRGIAKHYGGLRVVDDLDLCVARGETVAIIGSNGSGKTTTLDIIAGSVRPDRGEIALDGVVAGRSSADRRAADGLARTFQNGRVFGNLTVEENIRIGGFVRWRATRPLRALQNIPALRWVALLAELLIALGCDAHVALRRAASSTSRPARVHALVCKSTPGRDRARPKRRARSAAPRRARSRHESARNT